MKVIFFDGYCNLCNGFFRFIIRHDSRKVFSFNFLENDPNSDTIIFVDEGRTYTNSGAVLRVVKYLTGIWKIFYVLILIPPIIRDFFYRVIARNRYHWFGRRTECPLLTSSEKERFLQ